jgi:uncharacterized delta-60 repeat protein
VTVVNPTPSDCFAGAGCLDSAFGTSGKLVVHFGGDTDLINDAVTQPDGKIVVGGYRLIGDPVNDNFTWAIARFQSDGSPDTSFGTAGLVLTGTGWASRVALQSDGKIVVAGYRQAQSVVMRFTSSGAADATFGTGGTVISGIANSVGFIGLALQTDGKILVGSTSTTTGGYVSRYLSTGALDKTFGQKGTASVVNISAPKIALQSTGKIILAGSDLSSHHSLVARLTAAGAFDTTFGSRGETTVVMGDTDNFRSVSVSTADDSIAAAGVAGTGASQNMSIVRLTANGAMVTSFGNAGRLLLDMHGDTDWDFGVYAHPDGRTVFGGYAFTAGHLHKNVIVGRLTASGAFDSSFGVGGVTETDFGPVLNGSAVGMAITGGRITLVGYVLDFTTTTDPTLAPQYAMIARYFQ